MTHKNLLFIITILIILSLITIPKTSQAAFGEGALIRGLSNKVYVIENGLKRWIKTADIFNKLRYSWANIISVSKDLLDDTPLGENITRDYQYPDGTLVKGIEPPVYLIEKGLKRWIPNLQIFAARAFKWQNVIQAEDKILNRIKKGDDISADPPNRQPQTFILDGPCKQYQDSIPIIETDQIEFKYSGRDSQGNTTNLKFETFLEGYDKGWRSSWSSSYTRKITLPAGSKTYTFYVRTKTLPRPGGRGEDGYYDTTPAFCKFKINLSSYNKQIEISSVSGRSTDPTEERITLRAKSSAEAINITGWTIKIQKRAPITIPQAVKSVYSNSIYNHKQDLILEANEKVIIYGGASPIGVNAYKVNKCLGYFDDKLEYDTCRYEHYQDPDFFKKEWRVYLNRTSELLTEENEEIILKDKNGLVVDSYSY